MAFRVIVLTLFSVVFAYLLFGIVIPLGSPAARVLAGGLLAILFGAILWVPLVFWQRDSDETTSWQRALLWLAFCGMGLLSFALVFTLARDVASLALPLDLHTPAASAAIFGCSFLAFASGALYAHLGVRVREVRVPLAGLPPELEGFRIVQVSDLHVGPTIRRGFVAKVVAKVNGARPDLFVFTGDAVDGAVKDLAGELENLSAIEAPCGRFYSTGNHEYYWDGPGWIRKFGELGITPLLNEHRVLQYRGTKLLIAGVPDPAATMASMPGPDFERSLQGAPEDARPRIVLCHQPKFAAQAEKAGFDLQLSGHTHGGQFIPWTVIASWVHKFNYGLHQTGKMRIYVSRGTGYWGPPVRIGSPAEITLLVLERASG